MGNEFYMQLALSEAWKYQGLTYPNPAVGAVVVCEGRLLSVAAHQSAGTSHAEVLALLEAYEALSNETLNFDKFDSHQAHTFLTSLPKEIFSNCEVYVTLEPCSHEGKTPSCASLLLALKPKCVVVATADPIDEHSGGIERLKELGIEVSIGMCEDEAKALIEPFMIWQERAFVLFKLAQTSNGRIGGKISCQDSQEHTHKLRAKCDTLLIGGNTVRVDRPTLDCRYIEPQAPNVVIYSKKDDFDKEIPLFSVANREVNIQDNLDFLNTPSFVLVEGGEGMLNALQGKIDWLLLYQAPKMSQELSYNVDMNLAYLHTKKSGVDRLLWSRVV